MYLLKYMAQCGICSRRNAVELIKGGVVLVNGIVVTMPYITIDPEKDTIKYQGKILKPQKHVYLLLNKPKGYVSTCVDSRGRKTVLELVEAATKERIYPVGRLDRDSTGLLLFTNDGALAQKLSHPRYEVTKIYKVLLNKSFAPADCAKILAGVALDDGVMKTDSCSYEETGDTCSVTVQIHSGKNRIVRRLFAALGYKVKKLDRIGYAGLSLQGLTRGAWRFLTRDEVTVLQPPLLQPFLQQEQRHLLAPFVALLLL